MSPDPDKSGPYQTGWTRRQISLAIVAAVVSLVVSGGILVAIVVVMERMESPSDRWPDWAAKFTVIIFLGIFIGLWKVAFAFLVQRYDTNAS